MSRLVRVGMMVDNNYYGNYRCGRDAVADGLVLLLLLLFVYTMGMRGYFIHIYCKLIRQACN